MIMKLTRKQIEQIIFEADTFYGKLFEILLILFIVASIAVVMLDSIESFSIAYGSSFTVAEWVFTVLFTLVAYGQLIIESSRIFNIENDLLDEIFDFMVRDFSKFALALYSKPSNSEAQKEHCLAMIKSPVANEARFLSIWENKVYTLKGQYQMND